MPHAPTGPTNQKRHITSGKPPPVRTRDRRDPRCALLGDRRDFRSSPLDRHVAPWASPADCLCRTVSYPHDVGLFTVAESTVTVEAVRLPSHLLVPETNIHGMQRHGIDFTDADHPSYTHSVMGNVEERRFITRVRRCDSGQIGVSSRDRIL